MDYPVKKLEYDGTVFIRDYSVKQCIEKKENMRIMVKDETMTLTPEELRTKYVNRPTEVYESQFNGGKPYRLIGYLFEPDKVEL